MKQPRMVIRMRNSLNTQIVRLFWLFASLAFVSCGGDEAETVTAEESEAPNDPSSMAEEMPPPLEKTEVFVPKPEPTKPKPDPNG